MLTKVTGLETQGYTSFATVKTRNSVALIQFSRDEIIFSFWYGSVKIDPKLYKNVASSIIKVSGSEKFRYKTTTRGVNLFLNI